MNATFHFIRPYWLLAFFLVFPLIWKILKTSSAKNAWSSICDNHLLVHLIESPSQQQGSLTFIHLIALLSCLILGLAGPSFRQLPAPLYENQQARVVVLDMSSAMMERELSPNRLQRAKFKLHDLFKSTHSGQFALVVYAGEPFIASPFTADAQTITALLSSLTPDIIPVNGNRLDLALQEAERLTTQSGLLRSDVLVLTAETPTLNAIHMAQQLAIKNQSSVSILPMTSQKISPLFQQFAKAGNGEVLMLQTSSIEIEHWLSQTEKNSNMALSSQKTAPIWRDDGRWLLIPALCFLLFLFQRNWLQRIPT